MCGIAGFFRPQLAAEHCVPALEGMLAAIAPRGPDECGWFLDAHCGLGATRLSIIDLAGGTQPISDPSGRWWIAYNGEVYNFVELRDELAARGVEFRTRSDTEVVLQAWIAWGPAALPRLNGGFAFAIYDSAERSLVLVRDRFGKRPLFYAQHAGTLLFGSEMKCFLAWPGWRFRWDEAQLATLFATWTPLPRDSCFREVRQVLPGAALHVDADGHLREQTYAVTDFAPPPWPGTRDEAVRETARRLSDSVRIRLRSDVEVGTYLSGGLDSSIVTALALEHGPSRIHSFSVSFADAEFDESPFQQTVSRALGTQHHVVQVTREAIAASFPEALLHAELPVFRSAFVPMFLLSAAVREQGIKVVLTGEGADEAFFGYDIFKETHLLANWPRLAPAERASRLGGIYSWLPHFTAANLGPLLGVYERYAGMTDAWAISHAMRFNNSALARRLLAGTDAGTERLVALVENRYPGFRGWPPLRQAQALEFDTLLAGYLLATQGDRACFGHGVENRCPFLDKDVVALALALPIDWHLEEGMREKAMLKRAFAGRLPQTVLDRPKQPYRAPDATCFLGDAPPDYVEAVLSATDLAKMPFLDTATASKLVAKLRRSAAAAISPRENQAFMLLLSLSLLNAAVVERSRDAAPGARAVAVTRRIDRRSDGAT